MSALDYFDVPEDGAEAHAAGYGQQDSPYPYGTPDGLRWAREWGEAEKTSRALSGTFGATDDDYRAGGLKPPERDSWGRPAGPRSSLERYLDDELRRLLEAQMDAYRAAFDALIRGVQATSDDVYRIVRLFDVPSDLVGLTPAGWTVAKPKPVDPEPSDLPSAVRRRWQDLELEELVKPVLENTERTERLLLLDTKHPSLDAVVDVGGRWTGDRATMAADRPKPRARRDLPLGTKNPPLKHRKHRRNR